MTIQLTAKDAIGQTATSDPLQIVLPERVFHHPIASAVIEQRKRLIANPDDRRSVARALYAIAAQPPAYNGDLVVVLGLQVAQRRLTLDPTGASVDSVQSAALGTRPAHRGRRSGGGRARAAPAPAGAAGRPRQGRARTKRSSA